MIKLQTGPGRSRLNGIANIALDVYDTAHCFPGLFVNAEQWTKKFSKSPKSWERFKKRLQTHGYEVEWGLHVPKDDVHLERNRKWRGATRTVRTNSVKITQAALRQANKTLDHVAAQRELWAEARRQKLAQA